MTIAQRVQQVRNRVARACERAGRHPQQVTIVAVSKGHGPEAVSEVLDAGISDVGENRTKDLLEKSQAVGEGVRWHYVGSIQTNKVSHLDDVYLIHGLDRIEEAEALHRRGQRVGRLFDVLVEVNVGGEETKQGIAPDELEGFIGDLTSYHFVRPRGLMMMAPRAQRAEDVRWAFAETRRLRDRVRRDGLEELSMGMSDDFDVAVEEGATLIRIGRAIFGRE